MTQPLFPDIGVVAQVQDDWGGNWQARHQVLSRLSRYFRVVWMNPPINWRKVFSRRDRNHGTTNDQPGFKVYDPEPWLPSIYRPSRLRSLILREHLRRARGQLLRQGCTTTILSLWRPNSETEWSSVPFDFRCYHIDDEYSFSPVEVPIAANEMQLLKQADQVFVTSRALLEKKGWINPNTFFVPNGVAYQAFATPEPEPSDLAPVPHPRIGYAGFLKEQLDWPLLRKLAAQHSSWSFVFVGPRSPRPIFRTELKELESRKNVFFLGVKPSRLVPAYVQHFDVCIMPYRQDDYTKYIYPLKLHEYLASGLPTVGTRIRSLDEFSDVVDLPCSFEEWSKALEEAAAPAANGPELRAARQAVAKKHDWDVQVGLMASTLLRRIAPERLSLLSGTDLIRALPTPASARQTAVQPATSGVFQPAMEAPAAKNGQPAPALGQRVSPAEKANPPVGPVLLVSPWYRPAVGGVVEVAERLHRTFREAGVETHLLIAHEGRGGLVAEAKIPHLWRLASASSAFDRLTLKSLVATFLTGSLAFWRLRRFVREYKFRSVILLYPISYSWLFLLLRRTSDIRLISSLHGNDVTKFETYGTNSRWLIRQVLRSSDAIIGCAEHLVRKAQEIVADRRLPLSLIPNCVDSEYFCTPPPGFIRKDSRPTFVHVSNFAPKKRTVDIVEAFADPRVPINTRLIMVGDGPERMAASEKARALGVFERMEFVGMQNDVRPFLWNADVFILASDDEGAPLALLEAMACGLPWVSTAWGPAAMLPPEECGLVVPPHAPNQLAAAMAQIIQSPERYTAMGRRARHRAETDFREDTYVQRHLDLIRRVEESEGSHRTVPKKEAGSMPHESPSVNTLAEESPLPGQRDLFP
jgi:glycosyltransferase involved in cell wall biosynthesis